ncbi:DUF4058 family protein [Zavarzinella formosa]|uniref:DUF4058 family protein n=1 Tax=Zavarzinella formosa TaxID=360055 RepID=UPI00030BE679|nr:DUF4058 family protein [Zavarzinella formosa]
MPLRDHFRPPLLDLTTWESVHAGWPMMMILSLVEKLPSQYVAALRAHQGTRIEVDLAAYEQDEIESFLPVENDGGVATAVWAPSRPTLSFETDLPDADEFEVRVYDAERGRQLVAAVEIVSPSNKDRPEHRRAFVSKCVALLQARVSVTIIDLVTTRQTNLYRELLTEIGHPVTDAAPPLYAAACRTVSLANRPSRLETWEFPLEIGQPLPTVPLWLDDDLAVPLDLEASYEATCRPFRIP